MCKAETATGVVELPAEAGGPAKAQDESEYHGLTNHNRFFSPDMTVKEIDGSKEMIINGQV